jgi:hypothetical protein
VRDRNRRWLYAPKATILLLSNQSETAFQCITPTYYRQSKQNAFVAKCGTFNRLWFVIADEHIGMCQRPYIRNSLCPRPPFSKSPLANFSRTKSLSTLSEKKTIVRNADNLSLVLYLTTLGSLRNHMESNPPQIQRKIQAERKIRPVPKHSWLLVFMNTSLYSWNLEKLWVYRGFHETFYKPKMSKNEAFCGHTKSIIERIQGVLEWCLKWCHHFYNIKTKELYEITVISISPSPYPSCPQSHQILLALW